MLAFLGGLFALAFVIVIFQSLFQRALHGKPYAETYDPEMAKAEALAAWERHIYTTQEASDQAKSRALTWAECTGFKSKEDALEELDYWIEHGLPGSPGNPIERYKNRG